MKTIKKDELFRHLGTFLQSKGIELKDGSYTTRIQQGCDLLADTINATQKTVKQTKSKMDRALDQIRETIHQHTAPPPPPTAKTAKAKSRSKTSAAAMCKPSPKAK
jgi:hypothetical protein